MNVHLSRPHAAKACDAFTRFPMFMAHVLEINMKRFTSALNSKNCAKTFFEASVQLVKL